MTEQPDCDEKCIHQLPGSHHTPYISLVQGIFRIFPINDHDGSPQAQVHSGGSYLQN